MELDEIGVDSLVSKEFWRVMKMLSEESRAPVLPNDFKTVLGDSHPQFRGKGQQDAHEVMMVILEDLGAGSDRFCGTMASVITCAVCYNNSNVKEQPFTCLSIEIPPEADGGSVSLSGCIAKAFGDEVVEDNYNCAWCNTSSEGARKSTQLITAPQSMILHLKRFRPVGTVYQKNGGMVFLPETFHLLQKDYQICAVLNHSGKSMNAGHYTADLLIGSRWKECNDVSVRAQRGLNYCSSDAYLLFCEQI